MMKFGGISSKKEDVKFILENIGDPYISAYVIYVSSHRETRKAPYPIVPDLYAHNFPTGRQRINDSGTTSPTKAFLKSRRVRHAVVDTSTMTL